MQSLSFIPILQLVNSYDIILMDIWGVIIEGDQPYSGVVKIINQIIYKKKVYFISNVPIPSYQIKIKLESYGILNIKESQIITSGDVTRKVIADLSKSTKPIIYHLGEDKNNTLLSNIDYIATDNINEATIFLLSLYRNATDPIDDIHQILQQALKNNLTTICSNPDIITPNHGTMIYCAGYFAKIFEKLGGKVIYTGKPEITIYNFIFQKEKTTKKDKILMVGDTFETDILGAYKANVHSALVTSGNTLRIHNSYNSISKKIKAITKYAYNIGIIPTYITQIH